MRVVIACGGTGGHIYPALAIAEALRLRDGACQILFVGSRGLEAQLVPSAGWPFRPIAARQFPRRPSWRMPWALLVLAAGTVQAVRVLGAVSPHAVVSTGGYASAPVGAAAALLRIPLVLQEQNLHPGAANRILARFARAVSVPHEQVARHFGRRAVVTGVPLGERALRGDRSRGLARFGLEAGRTTVLILGGSQGARSINEAMVGAAPRLASPQRMQIVHQTGTAHEGWVRERIAELRALRYVAVGYIDGVADAYACADLVVCRAGAATLAEVTAHGLPCVAVPYPYAAEGHQEANARLHEAAGAAVVLPDRDLTGIRLAGLLDGLCGDPARMAAMGRSSRRLGRPDAASRVADLVTAAVPGETS